MKRLGVKGVDLILLLMSWMEDLTIPPIFFTMVHKVPEVDVVSCVIRELLTVDDNIEQKNMTWIGI